MACELTVMLENRASSFAALGEALGAAGLNIEGICGFTLNEKYLVHVLVKNAREGRIALENAGISVQGERDVLILDFQDRPGEFGKTCRRLAMAGINTNLVYLTTQNHVVLGVDDFNKACTIFNVARED